jgi:4-hydroxybenzoate polyprenyltransferase
MNIIVTAATRQRRRFEDAGDLGGGTPALAGCIAPTPLVIDLDGTLVSTDLLAESLLAFVKDNPLRLFLVLGWLLRGRAHLKRRLAEAAAPDVDLIPVREEIVDFARGEAASGRLIYIATAAEGQLASRLAARFDFVSEVFASDGQVNLKGERKAAALVDRFPDGFAYVGDAAADLAIWSVAQEAVFVGRSASVRSRLERLGRPIKVIAPRQASPRDWIKALRLHQWAKNLLIFPPLALGGALGSPQAWIACALGFLAMGCLASATYVLNDLVDLQDDRRHWSKRSRAFASGRLPITAGLALVPAGLAAGLALGYAPRGGESVAVLLLYLVTTLAYSFGVKRIPILDVVVLAGLFTLRLAVGVVCAGVAWSPWLLVFSMFVFASLSLVKRFTEIATLKARQGQRLPGRGYLVADEPLILALGVALASSAVFTMVMYLIEEAFRTDLYRAPGLLWGLPVVLALWLGRIWLVCGRGKLHDDPVVFAVRDRTSLGLGALSALTVLAAVVA